MFYTVVNIKSEGLQPGEAWSDFPNLPLPNTINGRKIWMQKVARLFPKLAYPLLKKGGFEYSPDLFKNYKLLYYPKTNSYKVSVDIYFEDTYNEGEKMMMKYIKKTGLFDYAYAKIKNKYIQL